jgi:hypothetical protein
VLELLVLLLHGPLDALVDGAHRLERSLHGGRLLELPGFGPNLETVDLLLQIRDHLLRRPALALLGCHLLGHGIPGPSSSERERVPAPVVPVQGSRRTPSW